MSVPYANWVRHLFRHTPGSWTGKSDQDDIQVVTPCPWAAGATHRGRVRPNNEDGFLCAPDRALFVIADGMGGYAAGEEASATAIQRIDKLLSAELLDEAAASGPDGVEALLLDALQQAHETITALGKERAECAGMGSTAVIIHLCEGVLYAANVGDSRAYLIRKGLPQLLTRDHSVAATLLEQGQLTAEEARSSNFRNRLTHYLGAPHPIVPAASRTALQPGDRVVLCSDGLWDRLEDRGIARVASRRPPAGVVTALIRAANAAGGQDNITAVLLAVDGEIPPLQPARNGLDSC